MNTRVKRVQQSRVTAVASRVTGRTMNTRVKRVQRLEADHGTDHKSAAEMTDAELCRIAGVPLDVTNCVFQRSWTPDSG
jgi:hypothetical protein